MNVSYDVCILAAEKATGYVPFVAEVLRSNFQLLKIPESNVDITNKGDGKNSRDVLVELRKTVSHSSRICEFTLGRLLACVREWDNTILETRLGSLDDLREVLDVFQYRLGSLLVSSYSLKC